MTPFNIHVFKVKNSTENIFSIIIFCYENYRTCKLYRTWKPNLTAKSEYVLQQEKCLKFKIFKTALQPHANYRRVYTDSREGQNIIPRPQAAVAKVGLHQQRCNHLQNRVVTNNVLEFTTVVTNNAFLIFITDVDISTLFLWQHLIS